MCHGLFSSPIVAHFPVIPKGNPFSTLDSDMPLLIDSLKDIITRHIRTINQTHYDKSDSVLSKCF